MSEDPTRIGVIIVAAGAGERLGRGMPKALVQCAGRTLLEHALDGVLAAGVAGHVRVVVPAGDTELRSIVEAHTHPQLTLTAVDGGASRPASVRAGLDALPGGVEIVLVHDAARALTPPQVFRAVVSAVRDGAVAVVPGIAVSDTIKVVTGNTVTATPDRTTLRAIQTPQGFDAATLRTAHEASVDHAAVTDDAMLVESLGIPVTVAQGDPLAFKVTTPNDLMLAEALVRQAHETAGEQQ
ncbi:2-C-methyl-D-erythritol 4-phosphate cytidylyltransferase [Arthrobacter tumbae]|uniref:2-C-methyl-D-erythritol 4-phosphate cytidylyltransferase n=1 Tax=Arthrobacter tumbae TaxID=163874 RepID=UPI00195CF7F8|nr:2-C-methyl-D-erythritol 4-phosphate cytidylyltransferase [Arthrobacter tumbae]MBM7782029.1 2-C-methyl-D-erythritol 4-phosphate cytidylyltransferase [Arthrobacter tumbae]